MITQNSKDKAVGEALPELSGKSLTLRRKPPVERETVVKQRLKNVGVTAETHQKLKAIANHPKYYGISIKDLIEQMADDIVKTL